MRWILLPFYRWRIARLEPRLAAYEARLRKLNRDSAVRAIGYLTLHWAMIETALDWCNLIISRNLPKPEPFPLALARKLEMFRRGHNKIPELAPLRAEGAALADLIADASTRRHDLVHGMGLLTLGDDIVEFVRHRVPREPEQAHTLVRELKPYSHKAIWDVTEEAMDLVTKTLSHTKELLKLLLRSEEELDDLFRDIGI
jgi:hypothetical protein